MSVQEEGLHTLCQVADCLGFTERHRQDWSWIQRAGKDGDGESGHRLIQKALSKSNRAHQNSMMEDKTYNEEYL